jgi:uncharacterized membrane protein YccC
MIGIAVPLVAGAAAGNIGAGLVASIGALNVAVADGDDPYRQRAPRMLAMSFLGALAITLGGLAGGRPGALIPLLAAAAFLAGMAVALGTAASDIGTVALVFFVVFSGQTMMPQTAQRPLEPAALALAGGLFQTIIALALWPIRRLEPERRALAALYRALARSAGQPSRPAEAPAVSSQTNAAQAALSSLMYDRSSQAERYLALLSQAERIRLTLATLARLRARLAREAVSGGPSVIAAVDRAFRTAAESLDSIAEGLQPRGPDQSRGPGDPRPLAAAMRAAGARLVSAAAKAAFCDAQRQLDALWGQLRAAAELAAHTAGSGLRAYTRMQAARPWKLRLGGTLATLRANLSPRSTAFRHAVRLAACVALGGAIEHAIMGSRAYWLPMTVALVLKPDFSATLTRGLLRLAGTLIGLALTAALFLLLPLAAPGEIALVVVFAFVTRCFGPANYGIMTAAVSALIVTLLALNGAEPLILVAQRGLNTLAGGLIALAGYAAWPTWERCGIADGVARMLDAYRWYFQAVTGAYVGPGVAGTLLDTRQLDRTRLAARLARSNLEAALGRLAAEPHSAPTYQAVASLLPTSHRFIQAAMSLEAGLAGVAPAPVRDAVREFARHVDLTLYLLAAVLRGSLIRPADLPDLREDYNRLLETGDTGVERYALANVEADRLTNSLNTLSEQILRWQSQAVSGALLTTPVPR